MLSVSMLCSNVLVTVYKMVSSTSGADPEFEEGGGTHRVGLVRPCGARSAPNFSLRTYNAQHSRRVRGHASPRKILKFRPYESASEAVRDCQNHAKCLTTGL